MKILLCEDDEALRIGLAENLRAEGWEVLEAANAGDALAGIAEADLLITDIKLPDRDGLDLLSDCMTRRPALEAIVMTGYASIPSAVEAMRRGARSYLAKPFDPDELILHVREADRVVRLRTVASRGGRGDLVGSSNAMIRAYADIDAAARMLTPALITGATGTGKECAARAVHEASAVTRGPFVAVNVGALPRELIESELFGHERGAFTGAHARKRGRFALADRGSLFLDEIDSLPLDLQPKLLRAIETQEIWPLGAEKAERVQVRILAATNARIETLVEAGSFRRDLYFRLNVFRVELPPLDERPEDIPAIARALLNRAAPRLGLETPPDITSEGLSALMKHSYQGNVRELANLLERGIARSDARRREGERLVIGQADLFPDAVALPSLPFSKAKAKAVEEWTKSTISQALEVSGGNVSEAARQLRLGRTALLRFMKKYHIKK